MDYQNISETTTAVLNTTQAKHLPGNEDEDFDPVRAEAGAIAGLVFGVLLCVCFIAFAGVMYFKRKRERDLEYSRQTKVLKQSSQDAGVYMDTTQESGNTRPRPRSSQGQGPEYKSLHKTGYESDSEEEL